MLVRFKNEDVVPGYLVMKYNCDWIPGYSIADFQNPLRRLRSVRKYEVLICEQCRDSLASCVLNHVALYG